VEQPAPHGEEEGWVLTSLQQFPSPQPDNHSRLLSAAQHGRLFFQAGWLKYFKQDRLQKGYLQVPVAAADVPKMVVIMLFGLSEFI
jgi:hypothetical protein